MARFFISSHKQQTVENETECQDKLMSSRELLVYRAKLCEQAMRFEDLVETMREICKLHGELNEEERNLLSCGYKNVIGYRRTSWRILNETLKQSTADHGKQEHETTAERSESTANESQPSNSSSGKNNSGQDEVRQQQQQQQQPVQITINGTIKKEDKFTPAIVKSVLMRVENELRCHCNEIIQIIGKRLLPAASTCGESKVFYYKMKGDYLRYLCETYSGSERKEKANESLLAYKTASERAIIELPPTHPVRLGLMLNFSVFYYEIMKSPERSCRLAKQAFDDAIAELDTLSEDRYMDSTIIMQLLRDNLNLWESEQTLQIPSGSLNQ